MAEAERIVTLAKKLAAKSGLEPDGLVRLTAVRAQLANTPDGVVEVFDSSQWFPAFTRFVDIAEAALDLDSTDNGY